MSVHVMSWVLKHSEETLGRRLVLLVLADHAGEDGRDSWPAVATIAHEARMSRRQVQRCLRDLESSGAITNTGTHDSGAVRWGVNMSPPGATSTAPEGATSTTQGGVRITPEPSLEQPSKEQPSKDIEPRARELSSVPSTVDRKPVTKEHAVKAVWVLKTWNELTGQNLRSADWLSKIILRIREYPEATFDDHRLIIQAALADPWWKGPPSPSVVYGSGAQFERSIQAVNAKARSEGRIEKIVQLVTERRSA